MIDFKLVKPGMAVRVQELTKLKKSCCVVQEMEKYAGKVMRVASIDLTSLHLIECPCWYWSADCFSSVVELEDRWSKDAVGQLLKGAAYD